MDELDSKFVPASLTSMRRTSTGSLMRKRAGNSQSHEHSACSNYRDYVTGPSKRTPISGRSWDDNSVGHGSVAARMRRERNKAIRRTQSTATYTNNPLDTHASLTSTLNLINTTSLFPWQQTDKSPWDDDFAITPDYHGQTAASKRSAGSLCNISSAGTSHHWDSRSIPEYTKMRASGPNHIRHSFTSGNHHSSPTSGCASIASSDIDSSDLAFFSMNDDSSLFDGDSLFSDTHGLMDTDSGFSSNIFSLLEEGSISCRTPFLNGDWPDSISELDFDCTETQNDVLNCDAHSDIGPSCSAQTDRNRLKKRKVRPKSAALASDEQSVGKGASADNFLYLTNPSDAHSDSVNTDPLCGEHPMGSSSARIDRMKPDPGSRDQLSASMPMTFEYNQSEASSGIQPIACLLTSNDHVKPEAVEALPKELSKLRTSTVKQAANADQPTHDAPSSNSGLNVNLRLNLQLADASVSKVDTAKNDWPDCTTAASTPVAEYDGQQPLPSEATLSIKEIPVRFSTPIIPAPVKVQLQWNNPRSKNSDSDSPQLRQPHKPIILSINSWNGMPPEERLGFIEQLSERITKTMGLQEQLEIINIIGADNKVHIPFSMSLDDIDSHKLSRLLCYLDSHKTEESHSKDDETLSKPETKLRRSNSDGNLPKTLTETQKEHRRRLRLEKKMAKQAKQRQRKENRQLLKEHKSGLFLKEKKVTIKASSEEEIDVIDI